MAETDIQMTICDYLALRGYLFWRNNNTPIFNPSTQRFRAMPKYALKGLPDIILIKDGRFHGIEVKRPKSYQTPEQKVFQKRVEAVGGKYFVARSLEDVIKEGL